MSFRSVARALSLSIALTSDLACQTKRTPDSRRRGSPEAIAEELATMHMLESFGGSGWRTRINLMRYREVEFDPETLLFLYVPSDDPNLHLRYASMTLQAVVNNEASNPRPYETTVEMTSELAQADLNVNSEATTERLELAINNALTAESAKRVVGLERELGSSPPVQSLLQNRKKIRDAILAILRMKPDLLKPFLERKPLSPELMKSRQHIHTLLDVARKER